MNPKEPAFTSQTKARTGQAGFVTSFGLTKREHVAIEIFKALLHSRKDSEKPEDLMVESIGLADAFIVYMGEKK